jgi:hypothetical protein
MRSTLFARRHSLHETPSVIEEWLAASRHLRLEVCPPEAANAGLLATALMSLRRWLQQGWPATSTIPWQPPLSARHSTGLPLPKIKQEFAESVSDLGTPQGGELLDRIHFARSMRELWHLRADIFSQVAVHHSQEEAEERLAWLNRHFPTRSPRSGFGALTPAKDMWP